MGNQKLGFHWLGFVRKEEKGSNSPAAVAAVTVVVVKTVAGEWVVVYGRKNGGEW